MNNEQHYLASLFEPASVAIIGASERPGSIGAVLVRNMRAGGYKGRLFFVNPKHDNIFGEVSYATIENIPQRVDLAVICTRAETVPGIIDACGRAGTRNAVVISAGFSEVGAQGAVLERALMENARRHHLRLIGPNCLGIIRPSFGINATFANGSTLPGTIGLISQSGAVCTSIIDWARPNGIGFSTIVSLGGSGDVDFGEILDYMVADPKTENIFLYVEGIKNARRFVSALRAAARCKPVLVIKVGRHAAGRQAALSHTGALVGADDVFDAALRRAGVVRIDTVDQMYAAARALFSHFHPRGNRLAIITNGGGPGVMAADHASSIGIPLATLSPETIAKLDLALPSNWSRGNPIDIIGDADPPRYAAALAACFEDDGVDGVLTILTPQAMTAPTEVAQEVITLAKSSDKPLLTAWMGEDQVKEARHLFKEAGVSIFRTPEPAVDLFSHISAYYRNQQLLMQAPPSIVAGQSEPHIESARLVIEAALAEGRTALNEMESKALLAAFRIPIAQTVVARTVAEAMVLAEQLGLPVVMKVNSPAISHKTDSGGVRLNIMTLAGVRHAWQEIIDDVTKSRPGASIDGVAIEPMIQKPHGRELIIGVTTDAIFGPAILLNAGGIGVDGKRCGSVALPPLNRFLAQDMLATMRERAHLGQFRNMPPVNADAIEAVLLRVSEMVCELPWIREMDINPLIVDEAGVVAVDARVVVSHLPPGAGRYDHMAIHPYPSRLVNHVQIKDGRELTVRPIKPEDAEIEAEFVRQLSPETKYYRFMHSLRELSLQQLIRLTQIDYDREMAFIATISGEGSDADREIEIGVARYATNPDGDSCEFAIVVADAWQGKGVARHLMIALIDTARDRGFKSMLGTILVENTRMQKFVTSLGFVLAPHPDDPGLRRATLVLN
jgi:acetyltransferase